MKKQASQAVEILPNLTDYVLGSTKQTTCKVTKSGSNIAMPKVKQPNKTGRDPRLFKKGAEKWRTLNLSQKEFWRNIAVTEDFWNKYTAFMSSFLISAVKNGIDYTMDNDLIYYESKARFEKYQCQQNSIERNKKYKVDTGYYPQTKATMKTYNVTQDSPLIYVKLLDLYDVNNALRCKLIYRSDPKVEYEYFPIQSGDVETGQYIKTSRPRNEDELYELFYITE